MYEVTLDRGGEIILLGVIHKYRHGLKERVRDFVTTVHKPYYNKP